MLSKRAIKQAESAGTDYAHDLIASNTEMSLMDLEGQLAGGALDLMAGDECLADYAYDAGVKALRKRFAEALHRNSSVTRRSKMSENEMIAWLDTATYTQLLTKLRFAPGDDTFFVGRVGDHFADVLKKRRGEISDAEHSSVSKNIGW